MSKTIKIDDEALQRLEEAREPEESYSAVIRRCVPRRQSIDEILKALRSGPGETTLDAVEESVERRRRRLRRSVGDAQCETF